jgi:hypothetical protein
MGDTYSLFSIEGEAEGQISLNSLSGQIDVVEMSFIGVETMDWKSLFSGFNRLYAITYSSGINFICQLLDMFEFSEIIFGSDEVMTFSLQEVMAYQLKTIERLRAVQNKKSYDLISKITDNKLKMFVAREKISHEKIYILEANDGRKRVVIGSANMSLAAFTGKQRENICFIDGEKAFSWYKDCFEQLKEQSSDNISLKALTVADAGEHSNEIPVMQTVLIKKALVIEEQKDIKDEVKFILDVRKLANKIGDVMPKPDKKGKVLLSPEIVVKTRQRMLEAITQEKELRSEYPQLIVDVENNEVLLNDTPLNLSPDDSEIMKDANLFIEYMEGYKKFHGDVTGMQNKYFAFANWFFVSPFMAIMRDVASKFNHNLLPYPVFGLVYGQSKAGKTSFLMTLLKMMIDQKPRIAAPDFTRSSIDLLKRTVKGAPIIVDDLTNTRFGQHAIETIKNDDFGISEGLRYYPSVVISANEDVKAVAAEVIRRTVICHVQAGLTNTEIIQSNIVRKVQKNIGTAFYRKYLSLMLSRVGKLLYDLKDDEIRDAPDVLAVSSNVIYELLTVYYKDELPEYVRELTIEDYFSEKVTGSQAIKAIQRAWHANKKNFVVDKRYGQLRYNAGQTWEADRILKELPEDLEAHKSREWIIMNLDRACVFFETDFKRGKGFLDWF